MAQRRHDTGLRVIVSHCADSGSGVTHPYPCFPATVRFGIHRRQRKRLIFSVPLHLHGYGTAGARKQCSHIFRSANLFAVYRYNQVTALYTGLGSRVHCLSVHLHIPGTHHQHPVCINLNSEGTAADRHLPRRRFLQRHRLYRHRVQQAHLFLRPGDGRLLPGVHRSGTPAADGKQSAKVSYISAAGTHHVRQSPTAKANQAVDHRKHHGQYCRSCTHTLFHFITRFSMR